MFGSALVYSNLQQRSELVPAVQPAPSAEPATLAAAPVHDPPDNPSRAEDQQPAPATTTVSVGRQSTETAVPIQSHPLNELGSWNSQPVPQRASVPQSVASNTSIRPDVPPAGSNVLPQLGPYSNVAPPQLSIPVQESKDTPHPAQRTGTEPLQAHPDSTGSLSSSKTVVVPATTTIAVQLSETLSSDRAQPGNTFQATLVLPLVVDGYLLADTGAAVTGRVENSRRAPLLGGHSELSVSLTGIETWNGQRTRMETGWRQVKGTRHTLTNTAQGAGMTSFTREGNGLMVKARTAVLPAGAQLTFILTAPLTATGTRQR